MFGDQLLSNTIKLCVYIYICTHQFLALLCQKVHMNDSTEMKDIWCNCEERLLPISNTGEKNQFQESWGWIDSLTSAMGRRSLINLSKSTKPLSEREREKTCSLFVCLIFWKLDWGHHSINEPAVGKYKVGWVVSSSSSFEAVGNFSWWSNWMIGRLIKYINSSH